MPDCSCSTVNIGSETLALRKLKTKEVSKLHAKVLISVHAYEVRRRKDHRGVDLISDALLFGRLWYDKPDHAIGYAMHRSSVPRAVIRVCALRG